MRKKIAVFTLCVMLFALCSSAEAQQPGKVFRIGYLTGRRAPTPPQAFVQGLRDLGYVEGKISPSSTEPPPAEATGFPVLQPSWCV